MKIFFKTNTVILIMFLLISCAEKQDEKPLEKPDTDPEVTVPEYKSPAGMEDTAGEEVDDYTGDPEDILPESPDDLRKFLPAKIPGFKKYPSTGGRSFLDDKKYTTVSVEFKARDNELLVFAIYDYVQYEKLKEWQMVKNPPDRQGMEVEGFEYEYGYGFVAFNDISNSGEMMASVGKRFLLKVNGRNIENLDLRNLLDDFDLEALAKLAML